MASYTSGKWVVKLVGGTGGPAVTVTVQVAVLLPSVVVTVIVVVPAVSAVTWPLLFTVATAVLLLDHETLLSVAFAGKMVYVRSVLPPIWRLADVGLMLTPVTATACTVTVQEAVIEASVVDVAVIVAVPMATPVTFPELSTVATLVLLLVQVTALPVLASAGV